MLRCIEPESWLEDANEIHGSAKQLAVLIDEVLEILTVTSGQFTCTTQNVAELVDMALFRVESTTSHPLKNVARSIPSSLPPIQAEGEALCRVMEILIRHEVVLSSDATLHIQAMEVEDSIVVTLSNCAADMGQPVELPLVRRKGRLGLELLLCCHLLEAQGGTLWASRGQHQPESCVSLNFSIPLAQ